MNDRKCLNQTLYFYCSQYLNIYILKRLGNGVGLFKHNTAIIQYILVFSIVHVPILQELLLMIICTVSDAAD